MFQKVTFSYQESRFSKENSEPFENPGNKNFVPSKKTESEQIAVVKNFVPTKKTKREKIAVWGLLKSHLKKPKVNKLPWSKILSPLKKRKGKIAVGVS